MYGARLGGAFMACENLTSMPEDLKPARIVAPTAQPLPPGSPTERHSMPSIFVGNRFNRCVDTEVYVPSWRERHETQNQSVDGQLLPEEEGGDVHSSTMDLPAACRTAPDQLQAELLYNYEEAVGAGSVNQRVSHKSDSPTTGNPRNEPATRSSSTTELCIEARQRAPAAAAAAAAQVDASKRDSIRRCISYQFLQMNNRPAADAPSHGTGPAPAPPTSGRRDQLHSDCKCRCCESSQCPSPRSSDSGMAGSCTIASPDPPGAECGAGIDVLDQVEPERRFDVCGMFREKFLTPEATQDEVQEEQPQQEEEEQQQQQTPPPPPSSSTESSRKSASNSSTNQFQINTKSIFLPSSNSMDESATRPRATPINASNELLFSASGFRSADQLNAQQEDEDSAQPRAMFRSGMYAHWWKKERLPPEVLRGIAAAYNKRLPSSKDSNCSMASMCSSCYCSLGVSGFSEGAIYCSICHNCCGESTETSTTNTTTTTASTCSNCPVCNEDLDRFPAGVEADKAVARGGAAAGGGAARAAALRLSAARDAFAGARPSYSSSLDCPICAARVALATEEGKQNSKE